MAKNGRYTGPSRSGAAVEQQTTQLVGDVEVLDGGLVVAGTTTIVGDLTVGGVASIAPAPTNEDDYAKIESSIAGVALSNNLVLVAIAGVTCTVTADGSVHLLHAHIEARCATVNAAAIYIAPVGSSLITQGVGRASIQAAIANADASGDAWARLPAGVGGEYGAFIAAAAGTWQITAATFAPLDIMSLAIGGG